MHGPATWILAVLVSVSVSFFTVVGFVFQARALRDPEEWKRYPKFGEVVLSPRWVFGFAMQTFPNFFGDVIAYGLAPLSLLAPLSGVAVALNTSIAPWMLGEKLHYWPDLPATGLILAGVLITSLSGSHVDTFEVENGRELVDLMTNPTTVVAFVLLFASLSIALLIEELRRAFIESDAEEKFDAPKMHFVVLAAWLGAGCGCITNIALKVFSELLKVWPRERPLTVAVLVGVIVPSALSQQQALNKALRLYPQTVFFPIYSSLLMLTNAFFGAIFFDEYKALVRGERGVVFVLGLACVVAGILLFRVRRKQFKQAQEMERRNSLPKDAVDDQELSKLI